MSALKTLTRRFDRLSWRFALLLAIALLPVGLIALLQTRAVMHEAIAADEAAIIGVTLRSADREMYVIREGQTAARALAEAILPVIGDDESCSEVMREVQRTRPQYTLVAYIGPDLTMSCSTFDQTFDFRDNPRAQAIRDDGAPSIYLSPTAVVSGQPILGLTHPVPETGGYIALSIPQRIIERPRTINPSMARIERTATLLTYTGDGLIVTSTNDFADISPLLPADRELADIAPGTPTTFAAEARNGERRIYAAVPLLDGELFALGTWLSSDLEIETSAVYSPLLLPVLMWLASLFVAWFAAERLVGRHIRKLRGSMTQFAEGGRLMGDLRMENAPLEMREVADSFVAMTETILRDEADLENALRQKEVLLREVHHRVKNNLQLIASIMNLQMRNAHSPEARKLLRSLQERVMSLATVHKELYHTTGLTKVHADELIEEITSQIVRLSSRGSHRLELEIDAAAIDLTPDQAVPLALFVTEVLTNAIKFSGAHRGEEATIRLELELLDKESARLGLYNTISEAETRPDATPEASNDPSGLGHRLLMAFAMQLNGQHTSVATEDGWQVDLTFPIKRTTDQTS